MPLFFKNKLLFIHIPKTGGSSIEKILSDNNDEALFYTYTGKIFINGHTPQHCTFSELADLNLITNDLKIFTVVRNPFDRVLSEYNYLIEHKSNLLKGIRNFDEFLKKFLDYDNLNFFDNHNLSQFDFLKNSEGIIDSRINIFKYFIINEIEDYIGVKGLSEYKIYKSIKPKIELNTEQKSLIKNFYKKDFELFYPEDLIEEKNNNKSKRVLDILINKFKKNNN